MPSFDVVCKPNLVELRNAVDQANREISNRFDFKGSDARVELAELQLVLYADDEFKLGQVRDVLLAKLAKRSVDARFLTLDAPPLKIGSDKLKQEVAVRSGLEAVLAKRIVQQVKDSKLKLTASIQGDAVRVVDRDRLRQHLGEHHDQDRHRDGRIDHADIAEPDEEQTRGKRRGRDIDGIVAEQQRADQALAGLEQVVDDLGAAIALLFQPQHAGAGKRHQGRLASREKEREHQADDDCDNRKPVERGHL